MGHRRPQEAQEGPRRPQDASRRPPSERDKLHIQCRFVVFSALVAQPHLGDILCPSPILGGADDYMLDIPPRGPQEASGGPRRGFRRPQEAHEGPQDAPGGPQEAPGGHLIRTCQVIAHPVPIRAFCSALVPPHTLGGLDDHMLDTPPWEPQEAPEGLEEATGGPGAPGGFRRSPGGPRRPQEATLSELVKLLHIRCRFVDVF